MRFFPLYCGVVMLAGCAPPPLPPAQTAKGTEGASVMLAAQPARLKAKLQASSKAELKEGGWLELRVYANERECTKDSVARQGAMGPGFSTLLNCEADVPASTPFTFRAEQETKDGVTREVVIEASYEYAKK
ncbi:hypothetical protein [Ramlibacter albus]|uniref:Uncharacterized protein n=1 Tax=Ramlibacter albus TaxID=2079448 RepID=A0A923S5E7_9BURK|nr:hypothetical protein [Ramlibacter albus]MBC5768544.1 hypothetical protein [Ramlibacter albus]